MRDYGKVHSTFWASPTIAPLSDDAKILALYLLTCTHSTIAGVFRLPDGYVSEDLRWDTARVRQGFAELLANGFANRCEATKWVWVVKHLEWNQPDNPNQRKAAAKVAQGVPENCAWRRQFLTECAPKLGLEANPSGTVSKPIANQEQEQEQEQKQENGSAAKPPARTRKRAPKTSLPEGFCISDRVRAWAAEQGFSDLDRHLEAFKTKCAANGYTYVDWEAAFMEAVRADWAKLRSGSPAPRRGTSSVLHADDDLTEVQR